MSICDEFAVLKSRESHIRFLHNLICHKDVTVNQIRYTLIIIQIITQILARMQTDASAISRKEIKALVLKKQMEHKLM